MAINRSGLAYFAGICAVFAVLNCAAATREAAGPAACQAAGTRSPISDAKTELADNPTDLHARFALADDWSDAGCFDNALAILQGAGNSDQANKEFQTRLRVAKSLVGEEHFFDDLDRANVDAKLKRDTFRCTALADVNACDEAVTLAPSNPGLLIADGDALTRAQRPAEALAHYQRAALLVQDKAEINTKISAAEAQLSSSSSQPDSARADSSVGNQSGTSPERRRVAVASDSNHRPPSLHVARANSADLPRRYTNDETEASSH